MLQKLPTFLPLTFAMSLSSHINSGGILSLNRIGEEHTKAQLFLVRIFLGFYYVCVLYLINSLFLQFFFCQRLFKQLRQMVAYAWWALYRRNKWISRNISRKLLFFWFSGYLFVLSLRAMQLYSVNLSLLISIVYA